MSNRYGTEYIIVLVGILNYCLSVSSSDETEASPSLSDFAPVFFLRTMSLRKSTQKAFIIMAMKIVINTIAARDMLEALYDIFGDCIIV